MSKSNRLAKLFTAVCQISFLVGTIYVSPPAFAKTDLPSHFTVLEEKQGGNASRIFKVQDKNHNVYILRLPNHDGSLHTGYAILKMSEILNWWIDNHAPLEKLGIVPHMYDYKHDEFILVENIEVRFSLENILARPKQYFEAPVRDEWLKPLEEFTKKLAYVKIQDVDASAMVFDGTKWKLLDYTVVEYFDGEQYPVKFKALEYFSPERLVLLDLSPDETNLSKQFLNDIRSIVEGERLEILRTGFNSQSGKPIHLLKDKVGGFEALQKKLNALQTDTLSCESKLTGT